MIEISVKIERSHVRKTSVLSAISQLGSSFRDFLNCTAIAAIPAGRFLYRSSSKEELDDNIKAPAVVELRMGREISTMVLLPLNTIEGQLSAYDIVFRGALNPW